MSLLWNYCRCGPSLFDDDRSGGKQVQLKMLTEIHEMARTENRTDGTRNDYLDQYRVARIIIEKHSQCD